MSGLPSLRIATNAVVAALRRVKRQSPTGFGAPIYSLGPSRDHPSLGRAAVSRHGPSDQGRFTKELGVLSTRSFEIDGR